MEAYHKFADGELAGLSRAELIKALTGNVMTCSRCCGDRVVITTASQEDVSGEIAIYYGVSCGGYAQAGKTGCSHNIYARTLEDAVNRWNAEIDAELAAGDPIDLAIEVKLY